MSELLLLGVSHKTAPLELRERIALPHERAQEEFLRDLLGAAPVREAVALSTCNRTEVYLVAADPVAAETVALGMLARRADARPTELVAQAIYSARNCDAARHLYRVTSGLESMIIGESEVQGQVRRAYELALATGTTGPLTNRLFGAALQTGKRVRAQTGIGQSRMSVSSLAVELARDVLGHLVDRLVVILGAGDTAELTARALAEHGGTIFVANRRRDRALALAERFGGRAVRLDELAAELERADILVASTASPHPILSPDELAGVMHRRAGRPLLVIDLAVPRDVDPACAELPQVHLYDLDDLQAMVERNRSERAGEARRAEALIDEEMERFARWLGSLEVLPTLRALRERGERIVEGVLADNAGRWESASPRDLERVEAVARSVAQRLLHEPTLRLKRAAGERGHARLEILRELFVLDAGDGSPSQHRSSAPSISEAGAELQELPQRRTARRG